MNNKIVANELIKIAENLKASDNPVWLKDLLSTTREFELCSFPYRGIDEYQKKIIGNCLKRIDNHLRVLKADLRLMD